MSQIPDPPFINRELSWLDFNERVLALAEDGLAPLLERVKFVAIFARNLDEFYQVRVAGLRRRVEVGIVRRSPEGLSPQDQLHEIAVKVRPAVIRHADIFVADVLPALAKEGIDILRHADLDGNQCREVDAIFHTRVFPVVTPLAVDPSHPFPYISNLSLNLAVLVKDPATHATRFARVKVPATLPRFVQLADEQVFVPLEDVIAANLDELFPGMEILQQHVFKVTRDTDLEVADEGTEDLLLALENELERRRFSPTVRLEIEPGMPQHVLGLLQRELLIQAADVHELPGPLHLASLWELYALDRSDLKEAPFDAPTHPVFAAQDRDIFSLIREQDVLVHHPYHAFRTSVQRFIEEAAADPEVLAIKQTLYQTSGRSPIVQALMEGARAGKQVVVLVEVKARFDELANIRWARTLERAGCHVVYGVGGLKTHCKLCLVVRREPDGLRRYVHVGTGNYNPATATMYEDLGLFTAHGDVCEDVSDLFNFLTGYSRHSSYRTLIVSPTYTRERLIEMIVREGTRSSPEAPGRIIMKMNGLVDEQIIDALYGASRAGVGVDLIVRGACALRPHVGDLSEAINVRSILGRYLEHSRVFYFRNGGDEQLYIGSADLMHRNLDRRVEALVQVTSPAVRHELKEMLHLNLVDNQTAWSLGADGAWSRIAPQDGDALRNLQAELMQKVLDHA